MRDFLNGILSFIGAESLTDEEFEALTIESADYDAETFTALSNVLISRESVSTLHDQLAHYFQAKGVAVTTADVAASNIYLGGALEY